MSRLSHLSSVAVAGCLLLSVALSAAEDISSRLFARVWRSNDGLPNNEVAGLAQDASGYLWLAYRDGVAKFDGLRFRSVPLPLDPGREFRIRSLLRTSGDRFWVALDGGTVIQLTPTKTNVFTTADGLPGSRPFSFAEARDGAIWIGYSDSSACRIMAGRVSRFTARDGLVGVGNCRLVSDVEGQIWFAQTGCVGLWRSNRFEKLVSLPVEHIRVGRARAGGVWICADSRVLHYQDGGPLTEFAQLPLEHGFGTPDVILEDRKGAVWIGTYGDGLFRCTENAAVSVETSQKTIFSLLEDREGSLWVGTAGGGLNRLRPRVLELHDVESGLPFEAARSICVDRGGTVWAAARNGSLGYLRSNVWHLCGPEDGWGGDMATCLAGDSKGAVWIGTYRAGALHRWEKGCFQRWNQTNGLAGKTVCALLPDSSERIWIGLTLPRGLQVLEQGRFGKALRLPGKQAISSMIEDTAKNIWIATGDGYLLRATPDAVVDETRKTLWPPRPITRLQTTADGDLWIAYGGGSVGRLRSGEFLLVGTEKGLPHTRICDLVPDARGGLWFSTEQGILRIAQDTLNAVADGRASGLNAIYYGSDELLSIQGLLGYSPGATRDAGNNLLFPVLTGLAIVHPNSVSTNRHPPQVVIESITADDEPMLLPKAGSVLQLKPGLRKLELQFSAPSFIAPASIRFRHQLEGVDEGWSELGTQRRVTYTHLPPGKYGFRVTACDYAGLWNDVGDRVDFVVQPRFWQTLSFKILCLAILPLAIAATVRYVSTRRLRLELRRLKQEAALQSERARIAKDIHDDLGASLTQISLLGELANRDLQTSGRPSEHVSKLSQTARQAFGSLDEIVWAINPRNDTLANLLDYIAQFALDFLASTSIRCRLDFPSQPPTTFISAEVRHAIYLTVREALNNVVKHAHATEVHLCASLSANGELQFSIQDNGTGFKPAAEVPEADGLSNIRHRLEKAGAALRMSSIPGSGTTISFTIPLSQPSPTETEPQASHEHSRN